MRKIPLALTGSIALGALVFSGGHVVAGQSGEWVREDGSVDEAKAPDCVAVLDEHGKLVLDDAGNPVEVPLQPPEETSRHVRAFLHEHAQAQTSAERKQVEERHPEAVKELEARRATAEPYRIADRLDEFQKC